MLNIYPYNTIFNYMANRCDILEAPNVCFGRRFYKRRRPPRLFFERALWREKRAHCCENVRFVMQTTTFLQSAPPCIWNMPFAANGVQSATLDPLGSK